MAERSYLQSKGLADQLLGLDSGYNPTDLTGDLNQNLLTARSTGGVNVNPEGGGLAGMLSNNSLMSGITGLGSTIAQLAALPSQIKWADNNTKALKQNMAIARKEQDRRDNNITGFNSIRPQA